jgi:VWFA-related protein
MSSARLCLAILVFNACLVCAQERPYTLNVSAALVSLDVGVFDSAGRPIPGLTQDDFLVYEDGQRQQLRNFGSADSPYDLLLLSDCSGSTEREWPLLREATARLLKYRRPQDHTMIAAFGDAVQVTRDWNAKSERELDRRTGVCAGTEFYEALRWAIQKMRGVKNRKAVVVLTDGVDNSMPTRTLTIGSNKVTQFVESEADKTFQKALRTVRDSGIPFYFVAVGTDRNFVPEVPREALESVMADLRQVRSRLEQLAAASGGSVIFPRDPEDVIPMYEKIGRELGTSYSLGYAPPNPNLDGKRHKIDVRLRSGNFQLHQSRDEYTAR